MQQQYATTEPKVLGFAVSPKTYQAIGQDMSIALFNESLFLATVMVAVVWLAIWGVFIGSAFFSTMPGANPGALRLALMAGGVLGGLWACIGVWMNLSYKRSMALPPPQKMPLLHRVLGMYRLHAALLIAAFAVGALVHGWAYSPGRGLLSLVLLGAELAVGYAALPWVLRFISGQMTGAMRVAGWLERLFMLLLVVAAVGGFTPLLNNFAPANVLFALNQVLAALTVPWLLGMLASAAIHFQLARRPG